ncbi:restriction endonuclease subunit S [Dactylosporangium sp. NPDC049525]|uniref:restriction endonuclease subunit S n=1 Tax=Dactylosporangium sp. NPDC049525 TaxID=3154730 RepID=UPI00342F9D7A
MTELPRGWVLAPLRSVLRSPMINGRSVPSQQGGFPVLRLTALRNDRVDLRERKDGAWTSEEATPFLVAEGDFLISRGNGSLNLVGRGALLDERPDPVAFPDTVIRIRANEDVIFPRFLALQWNSRYVRSKIENLARTTAGIYKVNQAILGHIPLVIPPLEEQRQIVDILEDHLSRLDAAERYIASARKLSETLLVSALTSDEVIASSPRTTLKNLLSTTLSNGRSVPTKEGGFPVLRLTALKAEGVDLKECKEGDWTADEARPFFVQQGDFMVARGNGSLRLVARGALVRERPDPIAYPDTMIRIRVDQGRIALNFLETMWNSPMVRRQIESMARTTAGIYKVNQKHLESVVLPVPNRDDQVQICARLEHAREAVARLTEGVTASTILSRSLRRSLLDAAFSGRLTGRVSDLDVVEGMAGV